MDRDEELIRKAVQKINRMVENNEIDENEMVPVAGTQMTYKEYLQEAYSTLEDFSPEEEQDTDFVKEI